MGYQFLFKRFSYSSFCLRYLLLFILLFARPSWSDTLYLTSTHWPPYTSQVLPEQGACTAIVRAALNAMGHELVVDFYPWSRAIKLTNMPSSKYLGFFPAYNDRREDYLISKSMATSPLGLVERVRFPISWVNVADLNHYNLGVVKDYFNTQSLDAMIAAGTQPVEVASSDEHNLQKVATARLDAAVIDVHVMGFLLNKTNLSPLGSKLQLNKRLLADKSLHIAFRPSKEGQRWQAIFDQGLSKIDIQPLLDKHLPISP